MPTSTRAPTRSAGGPLLATKLHAPSRDAANVPRPRLLAKLDDAPAASLALVIAPAGSGKTTLVTEWLATRADGFGWVSLDRTDDDPAAFWGYVFAALEQLVPGVSRAASALLFSAQSAPIEAVLTALVNALASHAAPVTLVLDDYHVIEHGAVHHGMSFLVEHLPSTARLVITSRAVPPFPVARLRAQRRLVEIGYDDLRFTRAEALTFLHEVMSLDVDATTAATLEARTEGWPAGLQLAALSMRGRPDVAAFGATFSGDHRHVADFLTEEVLLRQPADVRAFLLHCSILDRMSGPLCDALTGRRDGAQRLADLVRHNLFVVHLDDRHEWYRFHHLFADVLRTRLRHEHPDLVATLHARASAWFDRRGATAEAVQHALHADAPERAGDLVERAWRVMDRRSQSATWRRWAEALPREMLMTRPVLAMGYGWALLDAGEIDDGEPWLDRVAAFLRPEQDRGIVADEREHASLPGTLATARSYVAQWRGDMAATERFAREALARLPADDHFYRGIPAVTVALGQWSRGALRDAHASFTDAARSFRLAGNDLFTLMALFAVGELERQQGRLRDAASTLRRALRHDDPVGDRRSAVHRALAAVLLAQGDTDGTGAELAASRALLSGETDHRWCLVMADLAASRGDGAAAATWIEEATRRYAPGLIPDERSPAACAARLALREGRPDDALAWAERERLAIEARPGWLGEHDRITLAWLRVVRVEAGVDRGRGLREELDELQAATDGGRRMARRVAVHLLSARLARCWREDDVARRHLDAALALAAPERLLSPFVELAGPLEPFLAECVARGEHRGIARRIHRALVSADTRDAIGDRRTGDGTRTLARASTAATEATIVTTGADALTPRELETLRLIAVGLTNKAIAARLGISTATVKRHVANMYAKLGVSTRTGAVAAAEGHGFL